MNSFESKHLENYFCIADFYQIVESMLTNFLSNQI